MKNIKTINLYLTEMGLKTFKTVPTFKETLHQNQLNKLIVGKNTITVNHYIYSTLLRITQYDSDNMTITIN